MSAPPGVHPAGEARRPGGSTVSVALCTYNGERYLREQLESLAAQTHLPHELVICDDGSSDDTEAIAADFAARAPFPVRFHRNPTNLGSTQNFARAIGLCSGELIALADQDDVWLPEKVERLVAALAADPGAAGAFCDALVVDQALHPLGYTLWEAARFQGEQRRRWTEGAALDVLLRNQVVTGAALAFRREARELLLPIPEGVVHDGWIALLLAATARLVPVNEPLLLYRQHASNQIGIRKTGLREKVLRRRSAGAPAFVRMARVRYREAARRLELHGAPEGLVSTLRGGEAHLRTRSSLPARRLLRLPYVAGELATGRYFRYSNGLYSAVEDLIRA